MAKPLSVALLIVFALSFLLAACGSEKKAGTVTGFGQAVPAGGGSVQSYVTVNLDEDGTEVKAWLPQDDALWSTMRQGASSGSIRVEIQRDGEFWRFVQVLRH
jgi:predicted small secreted protein